MNFSGSEGENSGAIIGVDFGLKRVGLAVCDPERRTAVGAGWLDGISGRSLLRRIKTEAEKRGVVTIVIGCPAGSGRDVDEVRQGVFDLAAGLEKTGFQVILRDEGYTTFAVMRERKRIGGKSSKPRGWIDEASAVLILQDYLDSLES